MKSRQSDWTECSVKSFASYWRKKRAFDIVVCTIILLLATIPMCLVAIVIYLDDPHGSPFYKQIRIGRHGEEFYMYKFRTMYVDADKRKAELMDQNEMDGPVFKIKDDPRITRLGKYLRKLSVDELPQLFNVLRGNMSLVGPRPPLPGEVEEYSDYHKLRLIVTLGITCDWQIAQTYLGKGSRYTEIVKLNGLKSNVLYTGQVLELPEK